jgi:glycerol-3-phosphate dehydrogenase subunit C
VVCDTETCRWQIKSLTGTRTIHPVELIAEAYGLSIEDYHPPEVADIRTPAGGW